jgi:hypothetical protein
LGASTCIGMFPTSDLCHADPSGTWCVGSDNCNGLVVQEPLIDSLTGLVYIKFPSEVGTHVAYIVGSFDLYSELSLLWRVILSSSARWCAVDTNCNGCPQSQVPIAGLPRLLYNKFQAQVGTHVAYVQAHLICIAKVPTYDLR